MIVLGYNFRAYIEIDIGYVCRRPAKSTSRLALMEVIRKRLGYQITQQCSLIFLHKIVFFLIWKTPCLQKVLVAHLVIDDMLLQNVRKVTEYLLTYLYTLFLYAYTI